MSELFCPLQGYERQIRLHLCALVCVCLFAVSECICTGTHCSFFLKYAAETLTALLSWRKGEGNRERERERGGRDREKTGNAFEKKSPSYNIKRNLTAHSGDSSRDVSRGPTN